MPATVGSAAPEPREISVRTGCPAVACQRFEVHRRYDLDPASAPNPMPITLRNVRPDAAAKLRQLEVGAAALDRAARDLIPEELRHRTGPGLPAKVAVKAKSYLGPVARAVRSALAALARTAPYIASALRTLRGLLADAVLCVSLSAGMLLAFALIILLLAPPA